MPESGTTTFDTPDDFYEMLIEAHHGLSTAQSHAMNAALVLLLCRQVGSPELVAQALAEARQAALDHPA